METRYTTIAIALHWAIAALVLTLIGLGWYMVDIPKGTPERSWFYNLHKSIGLTTAFLIGARIAWRLKHTPPPVPSVLPGWEQRAAKASHQLLYACMVVMPLSGYIGSNFTKFGVTYFGYPLPPWGWEDPEIRAVFSTIHKFTSFVFVALIALHVMAALWHVHRKTGVFRRMLLVVHDAMKPASSK